MVTTWDLRVLLRALGTSAAALTLAWLVTAVTDEGGVSWGVRAGRTLPLAPFCAAVGTALALVPARSRGEVRALETLGRSPAQNAWAAALGGALIAWTAAASITVSPNVDVRGFFPVALQGEGYRFENGAFVDPVSGWHVTPDGHFAGRDPLPPDTPSLDSVPPAGRPAAALTLAFAGAALPLFVAHLLLTRPEGAVGIRRDPAIARVVALVAGLAVITLVVFHASAARRAPALTAAIPAALMLLASLWRYRSSP